MRLKLKIQPTPKMREKRATRILVASAGLSILFFSIAFIYLNLGNEKKSRATAPSANLNQARNGTDAAPTSPVSWVNGNLGGSQAHYVEGMSSPFQCIMTDLPIGEQVTLIIGYDVTISSKNVYDYLTHYNHILPHMFALHNTPETIDPLVGTGLSAGTVFTTYPIPAPSSAGSPVAGQPTASFNALASSEKLMTLFNGTIDTIYYVVEGSLALATSEAQIAVKFTPSAATAVLVWGGHIGSRADWGYTSGSPNSAGSISGSPFHMRLKSWSYGSLGSQDRGLAGGAVLGPPAPLPVTIISFSGMAVPHGIQLSWNTAEEPNNDYFTLERSSDGINYEAIDNIDGSGNTSHTVQYTYVDESPDNGVNYYRLSQTDFDGSQRTFEPISVTGGKDASSLSVVNVYPNPFNGDFLLTYHSDEKTTTVLEILNPEGKRVYSEALKSGSGVNVYDFNSKIQLSHGIYFVALSQGKNRTEAIRLVKK